MRQELRLTAWVSGLLVALFCVILVSAAMGPVQIDPLVVVKILLQHSLVIPTDVSMHMGAVSLPLTNAGLPWPNFGIATRPLVSFDVPKTSETIVFKLRLPRILLGAIVGVALATAGTVMQGFFRNPMADPSIVGVSSGAALGAVATIAFPLAIPFGLQFSAFAGALVTAFGVYILATENGRTPVATLLLAGVAVQTFLGAVISYALLQSGDGLREAVFWLMGHLHSSTWESVTTTLPFVVVGVGILFAYTSDLNILLMGEEDAHSLGVEVERTKRILLAVASIVTAAAVAVSGVIGFVGLIVPHVMRLLVGPDHRILLPTSAIAGAVFLVATDTVARAGAAELPVGIVTAALGAPFFLYLLRRREVHRL